MMDILLFTISALKEPTYLNFFAENINTGSHSFQDFSSFLLWLLYIKGGYYFDGTGKNS